MSEPTLRIVRRVTMKHGEAFAEAWYAEELESMRCDAFAAAGVMEWPSDDVDDGPVQMRHLDIEEEILNLTFAAAKPAIAAAFVEAARAVFARERRRS